MIKALFNWSGGKDSALALYKAMQEEKYEVISLLTTINANSETSSIHAIPIEYIQKQADSIGLPLYIVRLSKDKYTYEQGMRDAVIHFKNRGVNHFIFGDIFLEDVRKYREDRLRPHGIKVVEPLWGLGSEEVMRQFLKSGLKTKVVVTQADKLDSSYIGRVIDANFVDSLPTDIDVCGEHGEYHTFAYDGKIFSSGIHLPLTGSKLVTYQFTIENGSKQCFKYWQAVID